MKTVFKVHGFVQGVGYRHYVKRIADRLGVAGNVRNLDDGSVLVVAEADEDVLNEFGKLLNLNIKYGIQVLNIERRNEVGTGNLREFKIE